MKKILNCIALTVFLLVGINSNTQAQGAELKFNPPLALFSFLQLSAEFPIGVDFGIEPEIVFGNGGGGILLHGKYYFRPDYGNDKVYISLITGGIFADDTNAAAFGFGVGYKWIGKRNILFEIGLGVGRGTGDLNFGVPYGRLMVGYRFKGANK